MGLPVFNIVRSAFCTCLPKYNINPYLGRCGHGCLYCYAIKFPSFTGPVTPRLKLKKEILGMVRKTRLRLPVMFSDSTDPYQPLEREYKITRRCLEVLAERKFPLLIVTKSDLVVRDIDIFKKTPTVVSMTITTSRSDIASFMEPNAPKPHARFSALRKIVEEGIPAVVRIDPIIPEVNSDMSDLEKVISEASKIGVKQITASTMKLVRGVLPAIRKVNPELSRKLAEIYSNGEWIGGYKYLDKEMRLKILSTLKSIAHQYGLEFATCREGFPELNTTLCDGTAYCRKTLDRFLGQPKTVV
ncbi:radical SAM protein [Candidatus Bathyarchaeota archaeon]|nr:radical SAM protein [Candidatus Bathyarchaeota archaeon]